MIIDAEGGFVFLHIPKTGGESMHRLLTTHLSASALEFGTTERGVATQVSMRSRTGLWKHATLGAVRQAGAYSDDLRCFALIRDPIARAVSLFKYFSMHADHRPHTRFDLTSFRSFVHCEPFVSGDYIAAPQWTWEDPDVTLVPSESFFQDARPVLRWLGLSAAADVAAPPRANVSREMSVDLDRSTTMYLERFLERDIALHEEARIRWSRSIDD